MINELSWPVGTHNHTQRCTICISTFIYNLIVVLAHTSASDVCNTFHSNCKSDTLYMQMEASRWRMVTCVGVKKGEKRDVKRSFTSWIVTESVGELCKPFAPFPSSIIDDCRFRWNICFGLAYWRTLLLLRLHEFLSSFTSGYSSRKLQQKFMASTHTHTHTPHTSSRMYCARGTTTMTWRHMYGISMQISLNDFAYVCTLGNTVRIRYALYSAILLPKALSVLVLFPSLFFCFIRLALPSFFSPT